MFDLMYGARCSLLLRKARLPHPGEILTGMDLAEVSEVQAV